MKTLIATVVLLTSGLSFAQKYHSQLGEVDLKDCECKQCLVEKGVCIRTQTNSERFVPDKSASKPKKGRNAGPGGAVKS
jgi:hypothetical protein